jgi:hypothetical protein
MAETVNVEDDSREALNQMAVDAGLANAAKYSNKPAVADAINRVNAGEDAATVNAELAPSNTPDDDSGSDASNNSQTNQTASKRSSKRIHAVNGGHPTQFDETGNPVYDPEQV